MDPYDYDELYFDDGHYDDDPNPYQWGLLGRVGLHKGAAQLQA